MSQRIRLMRSCFVLACLCLTWSGMTKSTLAGEKDKETPKEKESPFAKLIGKKAPELIGEYAINGKVVKLADLRGKVVLVDFWALWCGPCITALPHVNKWHKENHDDGLEVIGVTAYQKYYQFDKEKGQLKYVGEKVEDKETGKETIKGGISQQEEHAMLKQFAAHHKLKYRIMTMTKDNYAKAHDDYRFTGIPTAVLIDRLGIVRMIRTGANEASIEALDAEIRKLLAER